MAHAQKPEFVFQSSRFTQKKKEAVYFPEKSVSFYDTVPQVGIRYIK